IRDFHVTGVQRVLFRSDFESAARAFVQEFHELLVDFVDAAAPVAEVHGIASSQKRSGCHRWTAGGFVARVDAEILRRSLSHRPGMTAAWRSAKTRGLLITGRPRGVRGRGGRLL